MPTSFRARLRSGERLIAPLLTLNSPAVVELLAEVGFDWLFIDAEHSPLDTAQMQALMQAAGATPCVVRLSASDDMHVKRALDIGAAGIIAPQVNSVEHAQRIVQAAKYAPAGQRGLGIARAHRYGLRVREYMQSANDETAVIVQAEHRDAVAHIEDIVRVDGVDGVLIGPLRSLGQPRTSRRGRSPDVRDAITRVRDACHEREHPDRDLRRDRGRREALHRAGLHDDRRRRGHGAAGQCVFGAVDGGSSHRSELPPVETR